MAANIVCKTINPPASTLGLQCKNFLFSSNNPLVTHDQAADLSNANIYGTPKMVRHCIDWIDKTDLNQGHQAAISNLVNMGLVR